MILLKIVLLVTYVLSILVESALLAIPSCINGYYDDDYGIDDCGGYGVHDYENYYKTIRGLLIFFLVISVISVICGVSIPGLLLLTLQCYQLFLR